MKNGEDQNNSSASVAANRIGFVSADCSCFARRFAALWAPALHAVLSRYPTQSLMSMPNRRQFFMFFALIPTLSTTFTAHL